MHFASSHQSGSLPKDAKRAKILARRRRRLETSLSTMQSSRSILLPVVLELAQKRELFYSLSRYAYGGARPFTREPKLRV